MNFTSWSCAIVAISLSGCFGMRSGQKFDDSSVKNIRTGKTTKTEVLSFFGQPPTRTSLGGGQETWTYQYQEIKSHATAATYIPIVNMFAGGAESTTETQALTIQFKDNVVSACTYGKSSSAATVNTGLVGMGTSDGGQGNNVTTPCEEAQ